jgi:hypothetical protein
MNSPKFAVTSGAPIRPNLQPISDNQLVIELTHIAPNIGFADLLRSRSYSAPGSAGSEGSGVSDSSSGGCSARPGCPLLRSSRSTRAIRSCSCSSEASRSCWSVSNCWSSGSTVLLSLRFATLRKSTCRCRTMGALMASSHSIAPVARARTCRRRDISWAIMRPHKMGRAACS